MSAPDLIIVGSGPGGYELAAHAVGRGLSVTIVERDRLGGTCLNRGCIPTKALCRSAEVLTAIRESDEFGISVDGVTADYAAAVARKDRVVDQLREGVGMLLSKADVIYGEARFIGGNTISVGKQHLSAPVIVVATGSAPSRLPIPGAGEALTSDDILSMTQLPESMIIIGGGVIGMEFASILNAYGVSVSVLEYCKDILPGFDSEVSKRLKQLLSRRGIKFITGAQVTAISGGEVHYVAKDKEQIISAEKVLMAVGRKPVIPEGLDALVEIDPRGVITDSDYRTSAPGIYAIGDVNGRCMLAHAATVQGLHLLDVITGAGKDTAAVIPAAVFTDPEVASVGLTEDTLKGSDTEYAVAKAMYRSNGKAMAMGCTDGFVKLIYNPSDRAILGCHIIGAHASDMIHEIAVAMTGGLTVDTLHATVHAHPSLSELIAQAALAAS